MQYEFQSCPKTDQIGGKVMQFQTDLNNQSHEGDQNSLPQCIDRLRRGTEIQCSADALGFESRADSDLSPVSFNFPPVFHQFSTNVPIFSSMIHRILHPLRPARCPLQHHPTVLWELQWQENQKAPRCQSIKIYQDLSRSMKGCCVVH